MITIEKIAQDKDSRKILIERLTKQEDNWQSVLLKDEIVAKMVNQIEHKPEYQYLVLFNLEFIEYMVHGKGININQITFVADNEYEGKCAKQIYNIDNIIVSQQNNIKGIFESPTMPKTENLIIIGNPPYHEISNTDHSNNQARQIYQYFVQESIKLNPKYLTLIIPSRWFSGGMGLSSFRQQMMKDKRMQSINHFYDASIVFPDVAIGGGVNYFLWNRDYSGLCNFNGINIDLNKYDIIIPYIKAYSIINKIFKMKKILNFKLMNETIFSLCYFGITTNNKTCQENEERSICCYFKRRSIEYVNDWKDNLNIKNKWKVLMSVADGGAYNSSQINESEKQYRGINNIFVIKPGQICSATYIVMNIFDTEKEAINFEKYLKTKFVRFLVGIRCSSHIFSKKEFTFVPDLGKYNKEWTDQELYKLFNLTQEEIDIIESKIL